MNGQIILADIVLIMQRVIGAMKRGLQRLYVPNQRTPLEMKFCNAASLLAGFWIGAYMGEHFEFLYNLVLKDFVPESEYIKKILPARQRSTQLPPHLWNIRTLSQLKQQDDQQQKAKAKQFQINFLKQTNTKMEFQGQVRITQFVDR